MVCDVDVFEVDGVRHAWIPGYKGRYSATEEGCVFGHHGGIREIGHKHEKRGEVRYRIELWEGGRRKRPARSRAVLSAWSGVGLDTDLLCLHNDGNPSNDAVSNLRWGTISDNMIDKGRHGRHHDQAMTYSQKRDAIDMRITDGMLFREIAEHYGVTNKAIRKVLDAYKKDPDRYIETEHEVKSLG